MQLVECVPNFSEGRNEKIIRSITAAIKRVYGANLLNVESGASTNRTVITFVGEPDAVGEAAFQAIAKACELIDMREHKGEHPRIGATDVCPFVPVHGITMKECIVLAEQVGQRVGNQLHVPVYLYAQAARSAERRNLANIRRGEYEFLPTKMKEDWFHPDFGPHEFNARSGATVIGARPVLVAYNINLGTRSLKVARQIAAVIRATDRHPASIKQAAVSGDAEKIDGLSGSLPDCRAIGWYINEYEMAQVSINLLDFRVTGLHQAFEEVCRQAKKLAVSVTGSEIVGLVPLEAMLMAGRHYLADPIGRHEAANEDLVAVAVKSLGLSRLSEFNPHNKIFEYSLGIKNTADWPH